MAKTIYQNLIINWPKEKIESRFFIISKVYFIQKKDSHFYSVVIEHNGKSWRSETCHWILMWWSILCNTKNCIQSTEFIFICFLNSNFNLFFSILDFGFIRSFLFTNKKIGQFFSRAWDLNNFNQKKPTVWLTSHFFLLMIIIIIWFSRPFDYLREKREKFLNSKWSPLVYTIHIYTVNCCSFWKGSLSSL